MRHITAQFVALIVGAAIGFAAAAGGDPDKDPQMMKLLQEARHHIDSNNPAAAIAKCDAVISAFKAHYGNSEQKIFCARSPEESLGLMMKAAVDKNNAIALSFIWSDAYFMKAYALEDLGRMSEAKATLQQALKMSPFNTQYLAEMGQIYAREKNWSKAEQLYREAEDNASLSPSASKSDDLAKARRGLGYVLVELGKLDEAEKKYQQCIAANANDTKAKAELQYVREQKAKRKGQ
jgi:tetratricopeptide (TPR) repeat protein